MKTQQLDFYALTHSPHILISGVTGSGKSTLIHSLISAILEQGGDIGLIDPKRIELSPYKGLARFYAQDLNKVKSWLDGTIEYIDKLYSDMEKNGYRERCPYRHLFIIIDELADLMVQDKKGISARLQRITQLGRACNVHVIAATQAPDRTYTLPAPLKLNFTDRIALRCSDAIESKQIIGQKGAEVLPKNGFCIWKSPMEIDVYSIPYVSDLEITRTVNKYSRLRA